MNTVFLELVGGRPDIKTAVRLCAENFAFEIQPTLNWKKVTSENEARSEISNFSKQ